MRIHQFLRGIREAFTCPRDVVVFIVVVSLLIAWVIGVLNGWIEMGV